MQMLSTRGAAAVSPSMAILRGLAPDGGLYVPAEFPQFTLEAIGALAQLSYQERACAVLERFLPDFTREELEAAIAGAYGTGFVTRKSGSILFYSYRDPSPRRSIGCYADSAEFLRKFAESGESIEKFIIGALGDYDTLTTPRTAGSKAGVNALSGWTPEMEDELRRSLLATDKAALLAMADLLESAAKDPAICIVGPASALDTCSDILDGRIEL